MNLCGMKSAYNISCDCWNCGVEDKEAPCDMGTPSFCVVPSLLLTCQSKRSLLWHLGRQQRIVQKLGPLPPTWQIRWSSWFLPSTWSSPYSRDHLGSEPELRFFSLSSSPSITLPFKYTNKSSKRWNCFTIYTINCL